MSCGICNGPLGDPSQQILEQKDLKKVYWIGVASLVTAVVLLVFGALMAKGFFTPGVEYHLSAYAAAGSMVLAILPLAVAAKVFLGR